MRLQYKLMLPASFLLLSIGLSISLAFAHGDKKHDEEVTDTTQAALSEPKSSSLDSVYALIQSEFLNEKRTFERACFDCHTSGTNYPWYYKLPIVKGIIDADIKEAKTHMNMSDGFPFGGHGKPVDDLVAIREVIEDGTMPPLSYRLMHWDAKPSSEESDLILAWIERALQRLAAAGVYPTDSQSDQAGALYSCPMHSEITSPNPDNCSVCGMPLEFSAQDSSSEHEDGHDH